MKKAVKNSLLNILDKTIKVEVQKSEIGGASICPLILHQPKRPKRS